MSLQPNQQAGDNPQNPIVVDDDAPAPGDSAENPIVLNDDEPGLPRSIYFHDLNLIHYRPLIVSADSATPSPHEPCYPLVRSAWCSDHWRPPEAVKMTSDKFLEDTVTHARATATKGNQPMQTAHKCCSGKEDFYTYKSATQRLRPLLHPDLWLSTLHEVN